MPALARSPKRAPAGAPAPGPQPSTPHTSNAAANERLRRAPVSTDTPFLDGAKREVGKGAASQVVDNDAKSADHDQAVEQLFNDIHSQMDTAWARNVTGEDAEKVVTKLREAAPAVRDDALRKLMTDDNVHRQEELGRFFEKLLADGVSSATVQEAMGYFTTAGHGTKVALIQSLKGEPFARFAAAAAELTPEAAKALVESYGAERWAAKCMMETVRAALEDKTSALELLGDVVDTLATLVPLPPLKAVLKVYAALTKLAGTMLQHSFIDNVIDHPGTCLRKSGQTAIDQLKKELAANDANDAYNYFKRWLELRNCWTE